MGEEWGSRSEDDGEWEEDGGNWKERERERVCALVCELRMAGGGEGRELRENRVVSRSTRSHESRETRSEEGNI